MKLAAEAAKKLAESGSPVDDGDVSTICGSFNLKYLPFF